MTSAIFGHRLPITEEEFLALGETADRIELFDWSLYVTPAPTPRHQYISSEMMMALVGDEYTEHSVTRPGQVLHLTAPVDATIAPEELLPPH